MLASHPRVTAGGELDLLPAMVRTALSPYPDSLAGASAEQGIDVALRVRPSVDDSGSMVVKRLDHTTQILVASPELLIRQGTPQTLDDLAKLDSIAMSAPDGRSTWNLIGPGGVHQMVQHTPRYVADD
eukprot:gene52502-71610_t